MDAAEVGLPRLPADSVDDRQNHLARKPNFGHLLDLAHGVGQLAAGRVETLCGDDDVGGSLVSDDQVGGGVAPASSGKSGAGHVGESEIAGDRLDLVLDVSARRSRTCGRRARTRPRDEDVGKRVRPCHLHSQHSDQVELPVHPTDQLVRLCARNLLPRRRPELVPQVVAQLLLREADGQPQDAVFIGMIARPDGESREVGVEYLGQRLDGVDDLLRIRGRRRRVDMSGQPTQRRQIVVELSRVTHRRRSLRVSKMLYFNDFQSRPMNRYSLTSRRVAAAWVPKLYLWSIAMTSTDGLTLPNRSTMRSAPGRAFDE